MCSPSATVLPYIFSFSQGKERPSFGSFPGSRLELTFERHETDSKLSTKGSSVFFSLDSGQQDASRNLNITYTIQKHVSDVYSIRRGSESQTHHISENAGHENATISKEYHAFCFR